MSLFRGVADDLKLQDWLEKYIFPAEAKNVDREFVRWGTRLGLLEMALSGTTTFTDMYYFEDTVAEETKKAGMRGVLGQTVIGFPAPDYKTPEAALAGAETFLKAYADDPLITPAVAPHAIYTTSDETLQAARALADRYGKPLIIHLAETKANFDEAMQKRKKTPTATLADLGVLNGWTLVGARRVARLRRTSALLQAAGTGIAHCPSSNMMLASGVAPVLKMLQAGIPVGLGTDGVAGSNNDVDMFEEMDLAAKLQKVTSGDPTALPAEQAFAMATIMGAQALRMDEQIGSVEAGQTRGHHQHPAGCAQRRAAVQRLFATGLFAEGVGRGRCDGERAHDRAEPADADDRRQGGDGEGGGVSRPGCEVAQREVDGTSLSNGPSRRRREFRSAKRRRSGPRSAFSRASFCERPARSRVLRPGLPDAPPASPQGPRSRRSDSSVTSAGTRNSNSRTMPSPPRCKPAPPDPRRTR